MTLPEKLAGKKTVNSVAVFRSRGSKTGTACDVIILTQPLLGAGSDFALSFQFELNPIWEENNSWFIRSSMEEMVLPH